MVILWISSGFSRKRGGRGGGRGRGSGRGSGRGRGGRGHGHGHVHVAAFPYRVLHPVHQLAGPDHHQHQALEIPPDQTRVRRL